MYYYVLVYASACTYIMYFMLHVIQVVERVNGMHLKKYHVPDSAPAPHPQQSADSAPATSSPVSDPVNPHLAIDEQAIEQQIYDSSLLRLWRTGADSLAYRPEEDSFFVMHVLLLVSLCYSFNYPLFCASNAAYQLHQG